MTTSVTIPTGGELGATASAIPIADVRRRTRWSRRFRPRRVLLTVLAFAVALAWVFPVYWMMNSSLLSNRTLQSFIPTFVPFGGSFANYENVLEDGSFFTALGISLSITLIAVFFCLLFAFLAAVAISRFRFKGRKTFVLAVLVVQMLPAEGLFIAQYKMVSSVGLLNSIIGVSIIYTAAVVPFTVWMLRGFVAAVPVELEEAAYLDGASWSRMFRSVMLPLVMPGLVATSVFSFITAWNEFIFAMTLLGGATENYTVAIGLKQFFGEHSNEWGYIMAASTIITIPVMIFFVIVQRRLSSGLVSGAVKG